MRSLYTNALIAGLVANSIATGPSRCIKEMVLDPVDRCHSPQKTEVKACLANILDNITQQTLQSCFVRGGCDELDAQFEAQWVVESCYSGSELRRRQRNQGEEEEEESDEEETTTTTTSKKTTKATTTEEKDEPTTTEKKTTKTTAKTTTSKTEQPKTTEDTSENTPSTTSVIVVTVQAESTQASQTTDTSSTTQPRITGGGFAQQVFTQCFTTITFTTEGWDIVNTDSTGRVSRTYNSEKTAQKTKCADGLVCRGETCMKADNSLGGSGIAVAIFFIAGLFVSFATVIFLCCRDRRNDKKIRDQAEAAKAAKEAAMSAAKAAPVVTAGARSVSAGRRSPLATQQPLMAHSSMYPPSPARSRPSQDPFSDKRRI